MSSVRRLLDGESVLFASPFYEKVTDYIFLFLLRRLMENDRVLLVTGRNGAESNIVDWVKRGLTGINGFDELWKISSLEEADESSELIYVPLRHIYGQELFQKKRKILSEVGVVILFDASRLLGTMQMGLSVLVASMLTRRLIAPIEQMTARLDHLDGVTCYPELEPFMNMIKSQHEEILRSADMRVEFTANVSHELKTPLTSISGYAELIESGMATGEQARRFAGEIHKSSNRLLTLINDIIRLSQMDAPAQELTMETVDMAQIAANTVEQLRLNARKSEVTLALDARSAPIQADRRMMEELVYNLCDNAIRYNVRGGSVRVVVHPAKEKVLVSVQDTGIGISKEHQAHVFERFFRVDKSRSKATGGTGLGLAIVKHIAAKHGAQIQIDSELGSGTTITVTFARRLPDRPARP